MEFLTVNEAASLWKVAEQTVRKYLRRGQVPGAILEDGSWKIPCDASKPGAFSQDEDKICEVSPLLKN